MLKKALVLLSVLILLFNFTACKNNLVTKTAEPSSSTVTNVDVTEPNTKAMLYLNAESGADCIKALEYYNKALAINPKDETATNGKKLVELLNELSSSRKASNTELLNFITKEIQKNPLFSQLNTSTQKSIISSAVSSVSNSSASQKETPKSVSKASSSKSSVSKATTTIDYSSYVGKWYDKSNPKKAEIEASGGSLLEITSVSGNKIVFTLKSVQSPPANRIASIENVTGIINGNSISFKYTEDGWGNSGKGVLKLKDGEIYVEVTTTAPNVTANWDIQMKCYFKKVVK